MFPTRLLAAGVVCLLLTTAVHGSAVTFIDDYEGFVEAAPTEVHSIDFETLPDGSPSYAGAVITPEFNYTHLGATFLPHRDPGMYIYGNSSGHQLYADSYPSFDRNWIIAELVEPASAVGTWFASDCILSVFDSNGEFLLEVAHGGGGMRFIGIVSDIPIAYATMDQAFYAAWSYEFLFASVPDASSGAGMLLLSTIALLRRRRRAVA